MPKTIEPSERLQEQLAKLFIDTSSAQQLVDEQTPDDAPMETDAADSEPAEEVTVASSPDASDAEATDNEVTAETETDSELDTPNSDNETTEESTSKKNFIYNRVLPGIFTVFAAGILVFVGMSTKDESFVPSPSDVKKPSPTVLATNVVNDDNAVSTPQTSEAPAAPSVSPARTQNSPAPRPATTTAQSSPQPPSTPPASDEDDPIIGIRPDPIEIPLLPPATPDPGTLPLPLPLPVEPPQTTPPPVVTTSPTTNSNTIPLNTVVDSLQNLLVQLRLF